MNRTRNNIENKMIRDIERRFASGRVVPHPYSKKLGGNVAVLHRDFMEVRSLNSFAMTADGIITLREVDRMGDVVEPAGVDLKTF